MKKEILFRVNAGNKYGFGHLRRCLVLARMLREEYDPYFLVQGDDRLGEIFFKENLNFKLTMHGFDSQARDIRGLAPQLIVLDMMETPIDFVRQIKEYAPVLDLDDRGSGADAATMSVFSLPLDIEKLSNHDDPKYLVFDPEISKYSKKRYAPTIRKILVSFGGSDPAGLTRVMIQAAKRLPSELEWSFVRGVFNREKWPEGNYLEVPGQDNIFDLIADADLVVTSFGMTAYEAAAIGTPVVLLNPSEYHQVLTDKAGVFRDVGVYRSTEDGDNLQEIIRGLQELIPAGKELEEGAAVMRSKVDTLGAQRMVSLIRDMLKMRREQGCAVCESRQESALYRDAVKNIFRCGNCGLIYQQYYHLPEIAYRSGYFEQEYADQYGCTYLEDRENIDRFNRVRLGIIDRIYEKMKKKKMFQGRHLLEAGSAYGFFLDMARDDGWAVEGVEVSESAAGYAAEHLKLDIQQCGFSEAEISQEKYHAVAAWYVLEHLPDLNRSMERFYTALKRGGVLAFAVPNCRGWSARKHMDEFIKNHPVDHYYDFSVSSMKRLLRRYRFKTVKVRVTGIHFDRVIAGREGSFWDNRFFRTLYSIAARVFFLGDTFEIYAVKK